MRTVLFFFATALAAAAAAVPLVSNSRGLTVSASAHRLYQRAPPAAAPAPEDVFGIATPRDENARTTRPRGAVRSSRMRVERRRGFANLRQRPLLSIVGSVDTPKRGNCSLRSTSPGHGR
ncbi:hypothetical protein B0H15DRAFT_816327 [Mycena belliarum]|uniref:Uncharacterized protein n=1 Tax=Mycena belliarum TaxID=1033014 RepID=A0AAD6UK02_9AGAR|nr:hypothetical protein B0H15DRAFT_816327 [Mycena belliae]